MAGSKDVKRLAIAVIDQSPGNGHMFSFSSLFNGYDPRQIDSCPFPAIQEYLPNYDLPRNSLQELAVVTETRMSDSALDAALSRFLNLPSSKKSWKDCVRESDCVIITNDVPSERRSEKIRFALSENKLVFVDKLLARNESEIEELLLEQRYSGQIFAASGVPYAPCFQGLVASQEMLSLKVEIPKTWSLYGIHGVELVLSIMEGIDESLYQIEIQTKCKETRVRLGSERFQRMNIEIITTGKDDTPISVVCDYEDKSSRIVMRDPLLAFEAMLQRWLSPTQRNFENEYSRYLKAATILEHSK